MAVKYEGLWTVALTDAGATWRASFVIEIKDINTGQISWHYFGVTEAEMPRSTLEANRPERWTLPYFEYPYVNFPSAFGDLPEEMAFEIYDLAVPSGLNREGVW